MHASQPQCIPRRDVLKSPYGLFRFGYGGYAAVYRVHGIIAAPRPQALLDALGVDDWDTDGDDDDDNGSDKHEAEAESNEAEDEQTPEGEKLATFTYTQPNMHGLTICVLFLSSLLPHIYVYTGFDPQPNPRP